MPFSSAACRHPVRCPRAAQHGGALLIILVIISVVALGLVVQALNSATAQIGRDNLTTAALAQAKEALLAYAASTTLTPMGATRPGDLPCPDLNDDGWAAASCDLQSQRLGRLPWKTLGLNDLRDNSGERLWYAVSINFKNSSRVGTLNSDSAASITVRDSGGAVSYDATSGNGAIAVILAPGAALTRQDSVVQDRTGTVPCPAATTPHCVASNYLDNITGVEDNADFIDSNANGLLQGPRKDAAGTVILNDRLIAITPKDLMPLLEKRVAGEVLKCLTEYAALPANQGHYPWAAPLNTAAAPLYADTTNARFGRVPDTPFTQSRSDSGNNMSTSWGAGCTISSGAGWWLNWKEMVFYALANPYRPVSPMTTPNCGACLTVNPPASTATRQVAVMVAGRRLAAVSAGQPRTSNNNKGTIANYLENENASSTDDTFERNGSSDTFNDITAFTP